MKRVKDKIKVCFFDIDGTIYEHRLHDFPHSTQSALYRLKEQGYKIVIATSRCRMETEHTPSFFKRFPFDAMIFDGGAVIQIGQELFREKTIDPQDMEAIVKMCDQEHLYLRYANNECDHFHEAVPTAIRDVYFQLYLMIPSVKPYAGEKVTNVLLYCNQNQLEKLCAKLKHSSIIDHQELYEITAHDVNKATAIREVMAYWGYSMDEVIAFGDGYNDVEMLKSAGIGVAMGNACEQAKAAADYVTADISEDGIYKACRHYELFEEDLQA